MGRYTRKPYNKGGRGGARRVGSHRIARHPKQVESSYYCRVFGGCDKIFIDVKVPSGLAWVGSAKIGAALPPGRREPGGGAGARGDEVGGNLEFPGSGGIEGFPQSGNEPWGGAFLGNASAPQHASDLVNPLGKDRGSRWRIDCGELKKLTCATIKRAAALSDSPRATEIERAPEPAAGGPGSTLPSQKKRTKRGDGLGDGPALQTLQSLETRPPLQASTSRRDKDSEELLRLMWRWWLSGASDVGPWGKGTIHSKQGSTG
ncbi:PREDICTED: uncharacterized protein LOC102004934 [Chinchilla lanigera]|uniref:uncharacterized protein LOC102004934 n=1 Tax=Chinchilla lanigera TaxID=34839 RepID=UPI00038EB765|nr:PREDICTED: uncharacterized protein LOC102004934 [Chinchilla lanigera]